MALPRGLAACAVVALAIAVATTPAAAQAGGNLFVLTSGKAKLVVPNAQDPTTGVLTLHDVGPEAVSFNGAPGNSSGQVLTQQFLFQSNSNGTWLGSPTAALYGTLKSHHKKKEGKEGFGDNKGQAAGSPYAAPRTSFPGAPGPDPTRDTEDCHHKEHHKKPPVSAVVVLKIQDKAYNTENGDVIFKVTILSKNKFSQKEASDGGSAAAVGAPTSGPGTPRSTQFLDQPALSPGGPDNKAEKAERKWAAGNITLAGAALFIDGLQSVGVVAPPAQ